MDENLKWSYNEFSTLKYGCYHNLYFFYKEGYACLKLFLLIFSSMEYALIIFFILLLFYLQNKNRWILRKVYFPSS